MLDKHSNETCPYPNGTAMNILIERGEREGRERGERGERGRGERGGEMMWGKSERFCYFTQCAYPCLGVKRDARDA